MTLTPRELVIRYVYANQSSLVEKMFEIGEFRAEEIEYHSSEEDCDEIDELEDCDEIDELEDCDENIEIMQWYLIDERLAHKIADNGGILIRNEFGTWWGRTTYGQAIENDYIIERIAGL